MASASREPYNEAQRPCLTGAIVHAGGRKFFDCYTKVFAEAAGHQPVFPLSRDTLYDVAAVLRKSGYAAAGNCLDKALAEHEEREALSATRHSDPLRSQGHSDPPRRAGYEGHQKRDERHAAGSDRIVGFALAVRAGCTSAAAAGGGMVAVAASVWVPLSSRAAAGISPWWISAFS